MFPYMVRMTFEDAIEGFKISGKFFSMDAVKLYPDTIDQGGWHLSAINFLISFGNDLTLNEILLFFFEMR